MAFDRSLELIIGPDATGLLISDLDVDFNVERSITLAENSAEFVIYNAKETTRKEILKEGNNLVFKAGYVDEGLGTMFIGNIDKSITAQIEADWITTVTAKSARSSNQPIENVYLSLSYGPGTILSTPLREIGTALGLVVIGADNAAISLQNGWTFAGSARGALNYCKNILEANDASLYLDNVEIVIYNTDDRASRFTPVFLDYESGLKSVREITEFDSQQIPQNAPKRIEFESIIIPKIQANGLVKIDTDKVKGTFLIEKLNIFGNNYGGDFDIVGEAVA